MTLPGIGTVRVRDDTRRLRRLIATNRGTVLFATCSWRSGRWWISLNVEAADLHPAHEARSGGWVGLDRGLARFATAATADRREHPLAHDTPPKALAAGLRKQRRLAKAVSRKQRGSRRRARAAARLGNHHAHVAAIRAHFLHQVSNELVKTHARLALEDLHTAGMLANRKLARAISDAGWGELACMLGYKQHWRGGRITTCDRWYPSSKRCSACAVVRNTVPLDQRTFHCPACGLTLDRDLNAAANLAAWAETHAQTRDPQAAGPDINARRQAGAGPHPGAGETSLNDAGTHNQTATAA